MPDNFTAFKREFIYNLVIQKAKTGELNNPLDILYYGSLADQCWRVAHQKPDETALELQNTPVKHFELGLK